MGSKGLLGLAALLGVVVFLFAPTGCGGGSGSTRSQGEAAARGSEPQSAEASIEGFGEEAEGAEREAIFAGFDGYLEALGEKDYASACEHMDAGLHEGLTQITGKKGVQCAKALPLLLSPRAAPVAKSQLDGTVTKVRIDGERGFVVFRAPGARLYDMSMSEEGGEWKVANATAGVLAPEP